jgi:DNA-binding transcriptional ArsR family regulator
VVPETLAAWLGPAQARVLGLLGAPKSTTQLAGLTGQGLGSVGRHLKVARDARLIQRRRAGRSVLYYRTAAGDVLVEAQPRSHEPGAPEPVARGAVRTGRRRLRIHDLPRVRPRRGPATARLGERRGRARGREVRPP